MGGFDLRGLGITLIIVSAIGGWAAIELALYLLSFVHITLV